LFNEEIRERHEKVEHASESCGLCNMNCLANYQFGHCDCARFFYYGVASD